MTMGEMLAKVPELETAAAEMVVVVATDGTLWVVQDRRGRMGVTSLEDLVRRLKSLKA